LDRRQALGAEVGVKVCLLEASSEFGDTNALARASDGSWDAVELADFGRRIAGELADTRRYAHVRADLGPVVEA
jgi:hypothetical protein